MLINHCQVFPRLQRQVDWKLWRTERYSLNSRVLSTRLPYISAHLVIDSDLVVSEGRNPWPVIFRYAYVQVQDSHCLFCSDNFRNACPFLSHAYCACGKYYQEQYGARLPFSSLHRPPNVSDLPSFVQTLNVRLDLESIRFRGVSLRQEASLGKLPV